LSDEVSRWIDIEAPEADKLNEFLAPLGVPQPILESSLEPSDEPELIRYEDIIYSEFPVMSREIEFQRAYVSIIVLPSILITIHMKPVSSISRLKNELSTESIFHSSMISGLLYELIVFLIRQNFHFFQDVRTQIKYLSNAIVDKPETVELGDIIEVISVVDLFIAIIEDQNYCIGSLLASESKSLGMAGQAERFKDLRDTVQNGLRTLNRYEGRVNDLHQHYMLTLQDRTNNRLRVLTIISAIFLPLTLIAGIYGMNFEHMPELDEQYSYFVILGLMCVIALGMLIFFYVRGWFK
jgi:magnesium transporter